MPEVPEDSSGSVGTGIGSADYSRAVSGANWSARTER